MTPPAAAARPAELTPMQWLLREAVRANPLYVISAALLAYAVSQLSTDIDPQIGKAGGIIAILGLLHLYELAVLIVATIVLKRRTVGRDLHGLMIVAVLFLGGSFLALDELIAQWPNAGWILVPSALILAALKMMWYARLPGINLPRRHQNVILAILAAHSMSPLMNSEEIVGDLGVVGAQNAAWLLGWLSLLPMIWLIQREGYPVLQPRGARVERDPLMTGRCGGWAVALVMATGIAHLIAADWVFDRLYDATRLYPAASVIIASIFLLLWNAQSRFGFFYLAMIAAPTILLLRAGARTGFGNVGFHAGLLISPVVQIWLAAIVFYVAIARATRNPWFYIGLAAPLGVPAWLAAMKMRGVVPHFRAFATACAGFAALILGMFVSLYRERLLALFENAKNRRNGNGARPEARIDFCPANPSE